jgi:hypothetical protein
MKVFLLFLVSVIGLIHPLRSQTPSEIIAFEERVHNFGKIQEEKGKVSHTFIFENKGKTPVEIEEVNSSCGCIGKLTTKGPVKPGAKGKVTITFDPSYKSGFFSKEIVVLSNKGQHYNRIWVEGVIDPMEHPIEDDYPYNFGSGLYMRLKVMALGYMKPGETKEIELHYANSTGKEMILQFKPGSDVTGLKFTGPGKLQPNERKVIKFSYTMPSSGNKDVLLKLFVYVNNKKQKETLDLRALISR